MKINKTTLAFVPGDVLPTRFQFDTAAPLEVTLTFQFDSQFDAADAVTWTLSRSLLLDGLSGKAGSGDVTVWPDADDIVAVHLDSPDGKMLLKYSAEDVEAFVKEMYDTVDEDEEEKIIGAAFDLWIHRIYEDES